MDKDKIREKISIVIYLLVFTSVTILGGTFVLLVSLQHDFDRHVEEMNTVVKYDWEAKLIEYPMYIDLFPWSKYHKHSTRELGEEEIGFLKEKSVAECMVDMVNYDDTLIQDREAAISLMYSSVRRLITDDDREYYVWYQIPVEGVYIFAMVNMKGEIFTFRFVTDVETDYIWEGVRYVVECYEDSEDDSGLYYSVDNEISEFKKNRNLFVQKTSLELSKYDNVDIKTFYKSVNMEMKPVQITQEGGTTLMRFNTVTEEEGCIFLYFDSKTKKFSGYHLLLY